MTDTEIIRTLAEKCMEWKIFDVSIPSFPGFPVLVRKGDHWCFYATDGTGIRWSPLENIADAFMVVEKMQELGWMPELEGIRLLATDQTSWRVKFRQWGSPESYRSQDDYLSRAICLAAIAALEGK